MSFRSGINMVKAFLALTNSVAFLFACTSTPMSSTTESYFRESPTREQRELGHWVTNSQDGTLVVIGVANRHLRREDEIMAAKNDAAMRIAMFYGMRGTIESVLRTDGGILGFVNDSQITLEAAVDHEQFIGQMQFDPSYDVFVVDGGTLVRFRYETMVTRINFTGILSADGRPNWVDGTLPETRAYVAAVGVAQNQLWLRDTVMMSAQAAAARIIESMFTSVQNEVTETRIGTAAYIHSKSEGELSSFRVLEFWINQRNGHVYTLGIARIVE